MWVLGAMGAAIAVIESVQQLYQFHGNWISYRSTCEQHARPSTGHGITVPANTAAAWTATEIILLRQGEAVAASKAFAYGLTDADRLLKLGGAERLGPGHQGPRPVWARALRGRRTPDCRRRGVQVGSRDHQKERRCGKSAEPARCPGAGGCQENPVASSEFSRRTVNEVPSHKACAPRHCHCEFPPASSGRPALDESGPYRHGGLSKACPGHP